MRLTDDSRKKLEEAIVLLSGLVAVEDYEKSLVRYINLSFLTPEQAERKEKKEGRKVGGRTISSKYGKDNASLRVETVRDPSSPLLNRTAEGIGRLYDLIEKGELHGEAKEIVETWLRKPRDDERIGWRPAAA